MSDNLIASQTISGELKVTLVALLEAMIPASEQYNTPSAGDDLIVTDFISSMRGSATEVVTTLLQVIHQASDGQFADLPLEERLRHLDEASKEHRGAVRLLGSSLLHSYYRDDRVLESLGMEARAPFPQGNIVEQGDFSLLDPVRNRGPIYRAV